MVGFIKKELALSDLDLTLGYPHVNALYRHRARIREYQKFSRWGNRNRSIPGEPINPARHFAIKIAYQAAQTMNNPADIINVVIENLINHHYELPTFYRLD